MVNDSTQSLFRCPFCEKLSRDREAILSHIDEEEGGGEVDFDGDTEDMLATYNGTKPAEDDGTGAPVSPPEPPGSDAEEPVADEGVFGGESIRENGGLVFESLAALIETERYNEPKLLFEKVADVDP